MKEKGRGRSPTYTERQHVAITVQGQGANHGEIDVLPSADGVSDQGSSLTVNLPGGAQFERPASP